MCHNFINITEIFDMLHKIMGKATFVTKYYVIYILTNIINIICNLNVK